jgi:hypothetical protein
MRVGKIGPPGRRGAPSADDVRTPKVSVAYRLRALVRHASTCGADNWVGEEGFGRMELA